MKISDNGKKLLAEWEGFKPMLYRDVAGLPTIGVGHLLTRDELASGKIGIQGKPIRYANGLTEEQVLDLLGQDVEKSEAALNECVTVELTQNQFDALVSFVFNVGANAFKNSTLLKLLNQAKYEEVPNQLQRWVRSGGQVVQGLINRRENEIKLWNA